MDSPVPLMHHDLNDLGSLILIQITPNKRILSLLLIVRFVVIFSGTCLFLAIRKRLRLIFVCLLVGFLIETGPLLSLKIGNIDNVTQCLTNSLFYYQRHSYAVP